MAIEVIDMGSRIPFLAMILLGSLVFAGPLLRPAEPNASAGSRSLLKRAIDRPRGRTRTWAYFAPRLTRAPLAITEPPRCAQVKSRGLSLPETTPVALPRLQIAFTGSEGASPLPLRC